MALSQENAPPIQPSSTMVSLTTVGYSNSTLTVSTTRGMERGQLRTQPLLLGLSTTSVSSEHPHQHRVFMICLAARRRFALTHVLHPSLFWVHPCLSLVRLYITCGCSTLYNCLLFSNLSAPLASSLVGSGVGGGPTLTPTVKSHHVVGVAAGLVYGSAEHDRCGEPDYYFNVNAWGWRGLVAIGRLHAGGDPLPPPEGVPINATWGNEIIAEAVRWRGDILAGNKPAVYTFTRRILIHVNTQSCHAPSSTKRSPACRLTLLHFIQRLDGP